MGFNFFLTTLLQSVGFFLVYRPVQAHLVFLHHWLYSWFINLYKFILCFCIIGRCGYCFIGCDSGIDALLIGAGAMVMGCYYRCRKGELKSYLMYAHFIFAHAFFVVVVHFMLL